MYTGLRERSATAEAKMRLHVVDMQAAYTDIDAITAETKGSLAAKYDTAYGSLIGSISAVPAVSAPAAPVQPVQGLARRQVEINEWTSSNYMDTLFVFQIIFIGLCSAAILTSLYRTVGLIGGGLYALLIAIILLIIVFVIVRRAQYTRYTRDQRYWNRRRFDRSPTNIVNLPSCSGVANMFDSSVSSASATFNAAQDMIRKL
jgi:hypothetical protein